MSEIFSKLFFHNKGKYEREYELRVSDLPYDSEGERETDFCLYDQEDDENILCMMDIMEFDHRMDSCEPSGLMQDDNIVYATGLKYCHPDEHDVPEVSQYPQAKGKRIRSLTLFEAQYNDVTCKLDYYVFYRSPMGDIRRLHPYFHSLDLHISKEKDKECYITFDISRDGTETLECGRYYVAFRLRIPPKNIIDQPIIQRINIVPPKTKSIKVDSEMVGLESIYSQMASLVQQKIFNEQREAMNLIPTPINLHAAVMGGKGTGKTSFAHVLYDYYVKNGFITHGKLHMANAAKWGHAWEDTSCLEQDFSSAGHGMLYVENAASMIATEGRGNRLYAVETLVRLLQENKDEVCVVLADTPDRISQLLATADLQSHIGQVYKLPTLTLDQMITFAERESKRQGFVLTKEAKSAMKSYLSAIANATTADVTKLIEAMILNMSTRVISNSQELFQDKNTLSELKAEDVPQLRITEYDRSICKLNELIGLKKLKYSIETHLNLVRFTQLRRQKGLIATMPPLHMIFTGNPGTGKTTVASLLGEIYASLGILKTGQVITADRKKLVGQYIGDTEENTKRYLQQAHGNILLIDEAYTLVGDPDDKKDYGPKVLDCLLEELSKEQTDMIIILAGYPDEMEKMLHSNKGLPSRFPYTFHFEDYTEQELVDIAVLTAHNSGYTFSPEALERVRKLIRKEMDNTSARGQKHFGNARFVTRLISSQIIPNMSRRVLASADIDDSQLLSRIELKDVPTSVKDTNYPIDEALISRTLKELDELIGREEVKQTLHHLVSIARIKYESGEDLLKTIPLQWTFTGSTGTGKSSVARLLAQILRAFHLIASDRMTQLRMPQNPNNAWTSYDIDSILRDTMKQAGQGLLFIDLDDVANSHIDIQWLRCKLTSLTAEMPGSYAIVIAVDDRRLQTQPIDMPISTSVLYFADYTAEELMTIMEQRLAKNGYTLTDEAQQTLRKHIESLCNNRSSGFANARTIKHIYTAITSAAEIRAIPSDKSGSSVVITNEDVESIKWQKLGSNRIGFGA